MGREPSGNPFINAGALAVPTLIDFVRRLARAPDIDCNARVAESELATSSRNAAMAYFMKSFGNLHHAVDEVLRVYCHHCAIEMSCVELARAVRFLAHRGVDPDSGERVLDPSSAKRLSALMLTCGTYDAAGDFAYRVGLPAKSGVGGGIVALLPGECGICVWSPALEPSGNSHAGSLALEHFTSIGKRTIF